MSKLFLYDRETWQYLFPRIDLRVGLRIIVRVMDLAGVRLFEAREIRNRMNII